MVKFKRDEIEYLKSLRSDLDFSNLSEDDLDDLQDILESNLISSLVGPEYEATDESIICKNILNKLWD